MKKNKMLVIILIVFLILAIAGGVFAYLFINTDFFKSSRELFAKYFTQGLQTFEEATSFENIKIYQNLQNENSYNSSINIKTVYSEGGEISNPLNDLSAKIDIQKDAEQKYFYANGQILLKEENIVEEQAVTQENEYLQAEIIKQEEQYGIRFTDAVKQFVTVNDDENLENIAKEIGTDTNLLKAIINIIDGNENIISEEQFNEIKNKYLNIIISEISNGVFQKQKNAMITYNNMTTETNAYSVSLTNEQVKNIMLQILNNMKSETDILNKIGLVYNKEIITNIIDAEIEKLNKSEQIPILKITVYENKEITIRTVIELGQDKIIIENTNQNGELKANIDYLKSFEDKIEEYKIQVVKINTENQKQIEIKTIMQQDEKQYTISILSKMQLTDNNIEHNIEIKQEQDIIAKSLVIQNNVKTGTDFEKIQTLEQGNYIPLSSMKDLTKRKELVDLLKQIVPQKTAERVKLLKEKLNLVQEETNENIEVSQEEQIPQTEINKFNAKFEFYTGDDVSSQNVKTLLEIAKDNLNNFEITEDENEENIGNKKINIKLNIEKDKNNEDAIKQINEKIKSDSKYKVVITYKETNSLIDYITISEK